VPADPRAAAQADGWQIHPQNPAYWFKGQEVLEEAAVLAKYTAPNPTAGGATTQPPAAPATPATGGASTAIPSWAQ
jgi:hypothetical protein